MPLRKTANVLRVFRAILIAVERKVELRGLKPGKYRVSDYAREKTWARSTRRRMARRSWRRSSRITCCLRSVRSRELQRGLAISRDELSRHCLAAVSNSANSEWFAEAQRWDPFASRYRRNSARDRTLEELHGDLFLPAEGNEFATRTCFRSRDLPSLRSTAFASSPPRRAMRSETSFHHPVAESIVQFLRLLRAFAGCQ